MEVIWFQRKLWGKRRMEGELWVFRVSTGRRMEGEFWF